MSLRLALGAWAGLVAACMPAVAAPPGLAVYVTDADEDVFVALYGDVAVELAGCAGAEEARALLQLPAATPAVESTLGRLASDFALGNHPRLPCGSGARFDADWPATTPIWADLSGSGNYFLPAPRGGDASYGVPARCTGIKAALAIRERLQLPGVLQDLAAPAGLNLSLLLDCGSAEDGGEGPGEAPLAAATVSLHRFDTFLSAESSGETILVARTQPSGGALPVYLPIWRVDGRPVAETLLAGGPPATTLEAALAGLFGLAPNADATPLGAEAVAGVRAAPHVDLCLTQCEGYRHRHAAFLNPALDLGLTELVSGTTTLRRTRVGDEQLVWHYAATREAVLTSCDSLAGALGLPAPATTDWSSSIEAALLAEPGSGAGFACPGAPAETCVRRLAEGALLTPATFAPGADCDGARRLRVELPAAVRIAAPPVLSGDDFHSIELQPKPGIPRSVLIGTPGPPIAGSSSCFPSATQALLFVDHLPRLVLRRVGLQSGVAASGASGGEVVALEVQGGALVLDGAELGGAAEGTQSLARGVALCQADLYSVDSSIHATALGIQGVSARILVAGTAAAPALVAQPRYGLLASAESTVRLHHARILARTALVLRGGGAIGTRSELTPGTGTAHDASALQLERGASSTFTTSTVGRFRCVASFADAGSSASFVLPGNDLARDNTHLACGAPGRFTLLE